MEIKLGTRVRFVPSGWSAGDEPRPAWMRSTVEGRVVMYDEERALMRVSYQIGSQQGFECFKLPLLSCDRLTVLS